MKVLVSKLITPNWKLTEVAKDIVEGRPSRTTGPIRVSRAGGGRYFVMDGNHRVLEAMKKGVKYLDAVIDEYTPDMTRTGGAYSSMLDAAIPFRTNPRAYHGTHQEVAAFVSAPKRELRNYESIGTFVTTDKEHAKMFGKYIHQVDLPDVLKLYADHDRDDLRGPFLTPALDRSVKVLTEPEKKLLRAAFIAAPVDNVFFGMKSYEKVSEEFRALMRELDKDDLRRYKFFHRHPNVSKYVTKCEQALETARDIERDKLFFNKKYAQALWDWYTSRGYDGIAWENTCMDAGFHDREDHRQSQYLLFHPDKYTFSKVD